MYPTREESSRPIVPKDPEGVEKAHRSIGEIQVLEIEISDLFHRTHATMTGWPSKL